MGYWIPAFAGMTVGKTEPSRPHTTKLGTREAAFSLGILLSVVLVTFLRTLPHIAGLAILVVALLLVGGVQVCERLNIGLPITRHELRFVCVASVVSTWVIALLAILASQRYLNSESHWSVHLVIQLLIALPMPFAVRFLTGWYERTFWTGKVQNALKAAGVGSGDDPNLEAAARNHALPETLAWAIGGAWTLGTMLGNLQQTVSWDDGTIYSAVVVTMTTFSMMYYYTHPDQKLLLSLIKSKHTQADHQIDNSGED